MRILIAFIAFHVGILVGQWDAKNGYQYGLDAGRLVRSWFNASATADSPPSGVNSNEPDQTT